MSATSQSANGKKRRRQHATRPKSKQKTTPPTSLATKTKALLAIWRIEKTHAIEPPSGSDFDAAYLVRLANDSAASSHEVVVEFAAPSLVASIGYAEEVTRPYLSDVQPPPRIVVRVGGYVDVPDESRTARDERYREMLEEVTRFDSKIGKLEGQPSSLKRDLALEALQQARVKAIAALADLGGSQSNGGTATFSPDEGSA